jgi:hypothetical protein
MPEIYFLDYGNLKAFFGKFFEIVIDIFGIILIIPILLVFIAIRKRSKFLYGLFYFSSLLELINLILRSFIYFFSYPAVNGN